MDAKALVTDGSGNFSLEEFEIDAPQGSEVLVEIAASGVCHTDLDSLNWKNTLILGHEGAGRVIACGDDTHHVAPGDRVLLNWAIPCGECVQCRRGGENICENRSRG